MAKSGDEEHPPVTIHQADQQHGEAAKEAMPVPETGQEFAKDPAEADQTEQIDDEEPAFVDNILEADLFPNPQLVFF